MLRKHASTPDPVLSMIPDRGTLANYAFWAHFAHVAEAVYKCCSSSIGIDVYSRTFFATMAHQEKAFGDTKVEHYDAQYNEDISKLADNVQYGNAGIAGVLKSPFVLGAAFLASTGGFSWVSLHTLYLHCHYMARLAS